MACTRPHLRACPFCRSEGEDNIYFTKEVVIGDRPEDEFETGYQVRCIQCGASVGDEYAYEAVRLWNGEEKADDDED
jgi:hypothetical protein